MQTVRNPSGLKDLLAVTMSRTNQGKLDETFRNVLEDIGLSQHEISLYRTSLSLGAKPASFLAKGIKVQRTRVYDLISSLESRGLMETVERNHIRYYTATPPDRLLALVRDRKEQLDKQFSVLESSIPKLFAASTGHSSNIESRSVRGLELIKVALENLIDEAEGPIISIGDLEQVLRTHVGLSRWAVKFRTDRIRRQVPLHISIQGPPDLIEEKALFRYTLSSPDIPAGVLTLASKSTIICLELGSGSPQATILQNQTFCAVVHGLYASWLQSVQRIS